MPVPTLRVKRGSQANLPALAAGEPAFVTDEFNFYVGLDSTTSNNKFFGSSRYWRKETGSAGSGVRLVEKSGANNRSITLASPAELSGNFSYVLPTSYPSTGGDVLSSDTSGNLSWVSPGGSGGAPSFEVADSLGQTDSYSTTGSFSTTSSTTVRFVSDSTADGINLDIDTTNKKIRIQLKNVANFTNNYLPLWDDTNGQFGNSKIYQTSTTVNINDELVIDEDLAVNGGDITTTQTTASIFNTNATTVNIAGAATTAVNIGGTTGTTTVKNNLVVDGNLQIKGSTTFIETTTLEVEDNLIELGKVNGVAPTSDTNVDLGFVFHYYNTSASEARKSAVYWDESTARFVFGRVVSESSGALSVANPTGAGNSNEYAIVEFGELYINDFAGATAGTAEPVIKYEASGALYTNSPAGRYLESVIVDGGIF